MTKTIGHGLCLATALLVTSTAQAGDEPGCTTDSDCETGMVCGPVPTEGDSREPPCDKDDCPNGFVDIVSIMPGCVPGPCKDDSDCLEGQVCRPGGPADPEPWCRSEYPFGLGGSDAGLDPDVAHAEVPYGEAENVESTESQDGCNVTGHSGAAGQALWLLLAAAILARRRRR